MPSLTAASHNHPLTGLVESGGVRVEKQAQSSRLSIKKPEGSVRLSSVRPLASPPPSTIAPQLTVNLPRRHLYAPRSQPSSPDEPSDLLLS